MLAMQYTHWETLRKNLCRCRILSITVSKTSHHSDGRVRWALPHHFKISYPDLHGKWAIYWDRSQWEDMIYRQTNLWTGCLGVSFCLGHSVISKPKWVMTSNIKEIIQNFLLTLMLFLSSVEWRCNKNWICKWLWNDKKTI